MRIRGQEMLVFWKILRTYLTDYPKAQSLIINPFQIDVSFPYPLKTSGNDRDRKERCSVYISKMNLG